MGKRKNYNRIYYVQINETVQENIDEITCIFPKMLFEKYQKYYFTSEKYQLFDDFRFYHKFPL